MNTRYMDEANRLEEVWSNKCETVRNITDRHKRCCIAVMLENQRLMNECDTNHSSEETKRKLLDLVTTVFPNILAWNIVSIQPLLGPAGLVWYISRRLDSNNEKTTAIESEDICAKTRILKRRFCLDFGPNDVADDCIGEFDDEILTDLDKNCGTVGCIDLSAHPDKGAGLLEFLDGFLQEVAKKTLYPNWMVVNVGLYNKLKSVFNKLSEKISIYPHKAIDGILVGSKGESYMEGGYVYSPYIPFTFSPCADGKYVLMTRYGKKLIRMGSNYYGKLHVIDGD